MGSHNILTYVLGRFGPASLKVRLSVLLSFSFLFFFVSASDGPGLLVLRLPLWRAVVVLRSTLMFGLAALSFPFVSGSPFVFCVFVLRVARSAGLDCSRSLGSKAVVALSGRDRAPVGRGMDIAVSDERHVNTFCFIVNDGK